MDNLSGPSRTIRHHLTCVRATRIRLGPRARGRPAGAAPARGQCSSDRGGRRGDQARRSRCEPRGRGARHLQRAGRRDRRRRDEAGRYRVRRAGLAIGGAGVSGTTRGDGPGVRADVDRARGAPRCSHSRGAANIAPTAEVRQWGFGDGLFSHIENAQSASRAMFGRTVGTGIAMVASIANERNAAPRGAVGSPPAPAPGWRVRARTVSVGVSRECRAGASRAVVGERTRLRSARPVSCSSTVRTVSGTCNGGSTWKQLA